MSHQPLVSIITPSYNQAEFVEETILSVLNQDYPNVEHIVMDGSSSDGTLDILRRYRDRIIWLSEPDRGQADAINKGLRIAQGEVLAYLNSDDLYLPGAVRSVVEHFAAHPRVGLAYGDCQVIGPCGQPLRSITAPEPSLRRLIHLAEFIPQPAAFWRRKVMDRVGMLDQDLHYALDYDFFVRVAQLFPMSHIDKPLAAFRLHGTSKTMSGEEAHWRECLEISRRYGSGWHSPGYVWRIVRHRGLRILPPSIQRWVRKWLNRPQDATLMDLASRAETGQ